MESSVVGEFTNTSAITSPVYALEPILAVEALCLAALPILTAVYVDSPSSFRLRIMSILVYVLASACYPVCAMSFVRPLLYFIACSSQLMSNDIATSLDICLHRDVLCECRLTGGT